MLNGHQGLFAPGCLPWRTRLYHPSKFARDSQLAPERFGFGLAASVLAVGPLLSLGVSTSQATSASERANRLPDIAERPCCMQEQSFDAFRRISLTVACVSLAPGFH